MVRVAVWKLELDANDAGGNSVRRIDPETDPGLRGRRRRHEGEEWPFHRNRLDWWRAILQEDAADVQLVNAFNLFGVLHHAVNHRRQALLIDAERSSTGGAHWHLQMHHHAVFIRTDDPAETPEKHRRRLRVRILFAVER